MQLVPARYRRLSVVCNGVPASQLLPRLVTLVVTPIVSARAVDGRRARQVKHNVGALPALLSALNEGAFGAGGIARPIAPIAESRGDRTQKSPLQ